MTCTNVWLDPLSENDDEFLLALLRSPTYLEFVGDRGVSTLAESRAYLKSYFLASEAEHGFGYFVARTDANLAMGMVGLMQRDFLDHPDLGFAFLPDYHGQGVAKRACELLLDKARLELGLDRLEAFTDASNTASQRLLSKLGFDYVGDFKHPDEEVLLQKYVLALGAS